MTPEAAKLIGAGLSAIGLTLAPSGSIQTFEDFISTKPSDRSENQLWISWIKLVQAYLHQTQPNLFPK